MASQVESEDNLLRVGAIPAIDLRFLSQDDLNCLASLSDEFRHLRCDDIIVPKIDRSVFNESAGSRRQTYSKLRLAQRKDDAVAIRGGRRRMGLLTVSRQPAGSVDDSEHRDNDLIVGLLRELFAKENPTSSAPMNGFAPKVASSTGWLEGRSVGTVGLVEDLTSRPRKRRKKDDARRKMQSSLPQGVHGGRLENGGSSSLAAAQNGVFDVFRLANEDVFVAELRRRTAGLASEADMLGFLGGLPGRWASRRRRRKIVEASNFGEGLPKGWKILVGIRRKHGRMYVDCRKYISPSGQQFITYKEVYSHLMSSVGSHSCSQNVSANLGVDTCAMNKLALGKSTGVKDDSMNNSHHEMVVVDHVATKVSGSSDNDGHVLSYKVKNPVKAQFRSLLECRKCKVSFSKKEEFMQHLLTFHRRNTRTCRPCKTIGEGVIIKDGKYECQICHKIFEERHRYNGHVGVHVRHYVRSLEALPDEIIVEENFIQSSPVGLISVASDMNSSLGNCSSSLVEGSDVKTNDQQVVTSGSSLNNSEMSVEQKASDSIPRDATSEMVSGATAMKAVDEQNNDVAISHPINEKVDSVPNSSHFNTEENDVTSCCLPSNAYGICNSDGPSSLDGKGKDSNISASSFDSCHEDVANNSGADGQEYVVNDEKDKCSNFLESCVHGDIEKDCNPSGAKSAVLVDEQNKKHCELTDLSSVLVQSSRCLLSQEIKSNKGEDELQIVGRTLERRSGSEKLPVDKSRPPVSMSPDLDCGVALVDGTSVQPDWDALLPKIIDNHQLTTVCVWCRKEFNHEGIDPETQSDSVGFMCPACKAKISGQLNVLDNGLVKNFDPL